MSLKVQKDLNQRSDNTLSFILVSDDNGGKRFDWGSGEYYTEILDVNGANAERLNTFFKDHSRSVDSAIGKVFNVRVENGQILGDVTFGSDDNSQAIYRKYVEGILTDVSIGYEIEEYNVTRGADDESDEVLITRYSLLELSAVGIGFDSGAKKRSKDDKTDRSPKMDEKQLERLAQLEAMSKRNKDENAELRALIDQRDAEAKAEREKLVAENAELKRVAEVKAIADAKGEIGARCLKDNADLSVDAFRAKLLDMIDVEAVPAQPKVESVDNRRDMVDAMVDGLALRVGAKIDNPHKDAEKYRFASLTAIGNALLPENQRSLNPNEIAERSLLTGDFPLLLQSVGTRVLTSEFEAQTATFKSWITETDVPDFRVMSELTTSIGGGRLDEVLENGDLKELSATEQAETWKIKSFGNKFVLTREMIINDDLGNFTNMLANFGRMAMTTANGIAYDILQGKGKYANYKMADGSGIFVSARKNSATDALSPTALSAGRLAMRKHKSVDGKTPLNIVPKYLVVSPALEQTAREILGATNKIGDDYNTGEINVHQGSLELIVDAEIESDTAWYLLSDRRTIKMGYLAGTGRTPSVKMNDSTLIRTTFEGVFDIGVMVEDYKGLYKGNA